jgi:hypothetical protein
MRASATRSARKAIAKPGICREKVDQGMQDHEAWLANAATTVI